MSEIKVRFAPSPTGFMHIGNTRTALFNWLLAKKLGGKFMLRIDDTDRLRSKKEYEDAMRESLVWLGFEWSEEARQSARFDRYNEVTKKLMDEGRIYACYETPEELEIKRKRAMAKGLAPVYDRQALHYTAEDLAKFKAEGRKPHYRFKLLDGVIEWDDIVRGEDHTTNTASQIQMFEAIGGKVPTFAHLPLLTGTEGKLSKRLGSLGVRELKAEGVEAMAICSFLAKLGTSDAIEPYYSLDELAESLDFSKLGRSQPKFDEEELKHFNTKVVRSMPYALVKDRISADETFWNDVRANLNVVDDVKVWEDICHKEVAPIIEDKALTDLAAELLPAEPWTENTFNEWLSGVKAQSGKKGRELFHPLRKALTALDDGPELKTLLPLIGYEKAKKRLLGQKA